VAAPGAKFAVSNCIFYLLKWAMIVGNGNNSSLSPQNGCRLWQSECPYDCLSGWLVVCLSVCMFLSVQLHISKPTCPNFMKFSVCVNCSLDLVLVTSVHLYFRLVLTWCRYVLLSLAGPFLPRDAMLARYMLSSVSVCHKPALYQNG